MAKAKVTLPKGTEEIRIHRNDNTFFTLRNGEVVDLGDIPYEQRQQRLMDKHLVPVVEARTPAAPTPAPTPKGKK